uniref:SCP domain-containing protein n=1 Tax=Mesocestoides corti TaxID=53468 RepID=A0A5K3FDC9_MESCO
MRRMIYFFVLIWTAVADVPTKMERTQILEFFTNLRESVDPPASNMLLMRYSSELEKAAQKTLANCSSIGLDRKTLPEDAFDFFRYFFHNGPTYVEMLTHFASNSQNYNYDENKCTRPCLSYKVMVLATSNAVGCAQSDCTRKGHSSKAYLTICLLKKNGGNAAKKPYKRGDSCSECPDGFACHHKQCLEKPSPVAHSPSPTTSPSTILSQSTNPPLPVTDISTKVSTPVTVTSLNSPSQCTSSSTEVFPVVIMNMLAFGLWLIV